MIIRLIAIVVLVFLVFGGVFLSGCASMQQGAERPYGYGDVEK